MQSVWMFGMQEPDFFDSTLQNIRKVYLFLFCICTTHRLNVSDNTSKLDQRLPWTSFHTLRVGIRKIEKAKRTLLFFVA